VGRNPQDTDARLIPSYAKRKAELNTKGQKMSGKSLDMKDREDRCLAQAISGKRDPEKLAVDLRAIARRSAAHIRRPHLDHAELLYDEHGLPI
jgi:hypothetical protein